MSGYLLDTNIVSMLAPSARQAPQAFLGWLNRTDTAGELFLSVITIHEIEKGIANTKDFLPFGVGLISPDDAIA